MSPRHAHARYRFLLVQTAAFAWQAARPQVRPSFSGRAQNGVSTIFYEEAVSDKYAKTVAEQTGAKTAVLNPLELKPADGDYLSAMQQNLQTLRTALDCA